MRSREGTTMLFSRRHPVLTFFNVIMPGKGRHRATETLKLVTSLEQSRDEARQFNETMIHQVELRDSRIAELERQLADSQLHEHQLAIQLDTAVRANNANAVTHTFSMPYRDISDPEDQATAPMKILDLEEYDPISDLEMRELLKLPTKVSWGTQQASEGVFPLKGELPAERDTSSEITAEHAWIVTTLIPAQTKPKPTVKLAAITQHDDTWTSPTHVPGLGRPKVNA